MAETCKTCQLVHVPAEFPEGANAHARDVLQCMACIGAQKTAMLALLKKIADGKRCSCGAFIYMVRHSLGEVAPYTAAGLNHFIDCPTRDQFKKSRPERIIQK